MRGGPGSWAPRCLFTHPLGGGHPNRNPISALVLSERTREGLTLNNCIGGLGGRPPKHSSCNASFEMTLKYHLLEMCLGGAFASYTPLWSPLFVDLETSQPTGSPTASTPEKTAPSRGGQQGRAPLTHVVHGRVFLGLRGFDHPRADPDVLLIRNRGHFHLVHVVRFRFLAVSLLIVKGGEKSNMLGSKRNALGKNSKSHLETKLV